MIAVLVVRDGQLPQGGDEAVAESGGRALLACTGHTVDSAELATALAGAGTEVRAVALGDVQPGRWSAALATLLADEPRIVLPASADGRDLAPRLAAALGRPLYAGATLVSDHRVELARRGGTEIHDITPAPTFVATLQPGVRGVEPGASVRPLRIEVVDAPSLPYDVTDARVVGSLPADPSSIDLGEATRIVAGGAGLDSADRLDQLARIGRALGASMGATRVVTDRGWVSHTRQIGTTGVVVDPRLYLAFGISGAVQHTSGLGNPERIIAVNTDAHCPMMQLADLAVVSDGNETLDHLERLLAERNAS
jgi:electron transfer flavoprotein alpha subunit